MVDIEVFYDKEGNDYVVMWPGSKEYVFRKLADALDKAGKALISFVAPPRGIPQDARITVRPEG